MLKHFKGSIFVTIFGLLGAFLWAKHIGASSLTTLFVVFFLSILEVTLSFDNAVVNAVVLEKMTPKWQKRFLTWGILVAVFGIRFLLPVIIVSVFSGLSLIKTATMAIKDVQQYTYYLTLAHKPLVAFGGSFLMMVGLCHFVGNKEKNKWIKPIENLLSKINFKFACPLICLFVIFVLQFFLEPSNKINVVVSAVFGIVIYEIIRFLSALMEKSGQKNMVEGAKTGGFMTFIYLETLDASFSLDGVLGSFAISKDIIIITIGLAIGAMFVRSLTLLLVEKRTLTRYIYLVSGAHFAILSLAIIMFISIFTEVNEILTGSLGLIFVGGSFISSLIENKKQA